MILLRFYHGRLQVKWRACSSALRVRWGFHFPGIRWRLGTPFNGLDGPCTLVSGDPCVVLPTDKRQLILRALNSICASPKRVSRKDLQTLVGRLVWFCAAASSLRPWLQVWFHALHKPGLHFLQLDMVQLSELHGAIDKAGKVVRACRHCDAQSGWRVLELAGSGVRSANDVLSPPLKQGRVWVKFGEPEPKIIKFSQEELAVARFFKRLLTCSDPIPLVEKPGPVSVAAADAFAEDGRFGIGGWFLLPGAALHPSNIYYFTYQLQHSELPRWFTRPGKDLQAYIAALEALARLVLLDCQRRVIQMHSSFAWISLRQFCDNAGVVCVSQKGLSLRQPLAGVLQSTALYAAEHRLQLKITRVAGERNVWADALSRGASVNPEFWRDLDISLIGIIC